MAAFDAVSTLQIVPDNSSSIIDFRITTLPTERSLATDYDPKEHREPKNPIKIWMAYFNLLRIMFGAGMLGLPLAVSQAGMVFGVFLALFTGALITHSHYTLLWCLDDISRQLKIPFIPYRYGFRIALLHGPRCLHWMGRHGTCIIATFMIMSQVGICTVFVIFTTDSLRDIMDWPSSEKSILALIIPYLILEFSMKNLSVVSYVAMIGNLMNLIGMCMIIYYIFNEPVAEIKLGNFEPVSLSIASGTFLFNMSALAVTLAIDKSLINPTVLTKPFGVLNVGMYVPIIVGTIFGALGYWSFGVMEENILRYLPFDELGTMAIMGLYLIANAFAYPLQCYPAIQLIIDMFKNRNRFETPSENILHITEYIARPIFVLLTFLLCYLVPFQGPMVAFVGNLCTSMLALVFPALMELCLLFPDSYGRFNIFYYKDLFIIVLGLLVTVAGLILCGYLIIVRILNINFFNRFNSCF